MSSYNLLNKSEILISPIQLSDVNLNAVSDAVAEILGLDAGDVIVIDVRDGTLALDVLRADVDPHAFIGQEKALLSKLKEIPGILVTEQTRVSSRGMLGWITEDPQAGREQRQQMLSDGETLVNEIQRRIRKRVMVFPSGAEVEAGEIEDTNSPMIRNLLEEQGYAVDIGPVLKDDELLIAGKLRNALDEGYGIVITTGGVGAEDKDHSVEAILRLDPDAAVPYIVRFHELKGRHHKPGIRIGVGEEGAARLIALPGPNAEVRLCMNVLLQNMNADKEALAEKLAGCLRERLQEKMSASAHHRGHSHG